MPPRRMPSNPTPGKLPVRLHRFMLTVIPVLGLLHAYIGWRLLPALTIDTAGMLLGALMLVASTLLLPIGMLARFVVTR